MNEVAVAPLAPHHPTSDGVLSDSRVLAAITGFIEAERPEGTTSADILHVVYMLARKGADHPLYHSHQTLARHLATDERNIRRIQTRLEKNGWLARERRQGRVSALRLIEEALPCATPQQEVITSAAKDLAFRYQAALQKNGFRKRFPKGWLGQQCLSAQRILNRCHGDEVRARAIIGFALGSPRFTKRARHSMYHLLGQWTETEQAYLEKQALKNGGSHAG